MPNYHIKNSLDNLLKKIYSKKGDEFSEVAINWKTIAGEEFSSYLTPLSIKYYRTREGQGREMILKINDNSKTIQAQFSKEIIIQRINNYLGFKAISNIKLKWWKYLNPIVFYICDWVLNIYFINNFFILIYFNNSFF